MNTIILLLHLLLLSNGNTSMVNDDTCKVHEIPIDTPFRQITRYAEYYSKFKYNDTSDYQLIYISVPFDDALGQVLYYVVNNNTGFLESGTTMNMKQKQFDREENQFIEEQLKKSERGGYVSICDLNNINIVYSVCIIKEKGKVVFQYQGVNRNILTLKGEEGRKLENVTKLIHLLKK